MCVCARTSASLWAAPLPPLWVEDDEVVEVVEPWMAWLIQCSMLMLPWPRNHTLYSSWDIDWFKGGNQTQLKLTIVNETLHRDFIFEL